MRNWFYYWFGLGILFANKARYSVTGYCRPREFPVKEIERAVQYDREVVARFESMLKEKGFGERPFAGRRILELGPGADLGVGLLLLGKGAVSYLGYDKYSLADKAPRGLHSAIVCSIEDGECRARVSDSLLAYEQGQPTALHFRRDASFSFSGLENESVDLIMSNAAFEHFDDVIGVLEQSARVLASGGVLCAEVDLQTHTRVIRDRDPLNIYRYPSTIYGLVKFSGIPNRIRPNVYEEKLRALGFSLVLVVQGTILDEQRTTLVRPYLHADYQEDPALHVMSFMVVAKKAEEVVK
ncbi:MAG: methyltransferase domain-containing protein [Patescibacteria group bacterium]|jgi:SAM-dependent methyltransferase